MRCPQCGHPDAAEWFDIDRGTIFRCVERTCGVGFLDEQPDDETLAVLYETYYYPEHGGAGVYENSTSSKATQHAAALDTRVGIEGRDVLDFGCGVGTFLDAAAEIGGHVAGVEFDDVGREQVQTRGHHVRKSIDAFDAGSFDLIYMNDVIEHLRDPVTDLRALGTRLRPGGHLFVVTMNMRSIAARLRGKRWGNVVNPTHLWLYDEASLLATLQRAGFERGEVQRWPVTFDHHGPIRKGAQRALQRVGLDGSLRVITRPKSHPPS